MGLEVLLPAIVNKLTISKVPQTVQSVYAGWVKVSTCPAGRRRLLQVRAHPRYLYATQYAGFDYAIGSTDNYTANDWPLPAVGSSQKNGVATYYWITGTRDRLNHPQMAVYMDTAGMYGIDWYAGGTGANTNSTGPSLSKTATTSGGVGAVRGDGMVYFVDNTATPWLNAAKFNPPFGAWGSKLGGPASAPAAQPTWLELSPDGTKLATLSGTSPYLNVYTINSDGTFGARWTAPGTTPASGHTRANWSIDSGAVVLSGSATAGSLIEAYDCRSVGTIGSRYTNAASPPAVTVTSSDVHPTGNYHSFQGASGSTYAIGFTSSGGWGSTYTVAISGYGHAWARHGRSCVFGAYAASNGQPTSKWATFDPSNGTWGTLTTMQTGSTDASSSAPFWFADGSGFQFTINSSTYFRARAGISGASASATGQSSIVTNSSSYLSFGDVLTCNLDGGESLWLRTFDGTNVVSANPLVAVIDGMEWAA
jgi:hypothetical protein